MMTDTLREIEKGHEAKYKLDEETRFKVTSRRDRMLGLWAGEKLDLVGSAQTEYARGIVKATLINPEPEAVIDIIAGDLQAAGLTIPKSEVQRIRDKLQTEAELYFSDRYPDPLDADHSPVGG